MIFYLIAQNYISSNVGAWGMWACSLFLFLILIVIMTSRIRHFPAFCQNESKNSQMSIQIIAQEQGVRICRAFNHLSRWKTYLTYEFARRMRCMFSEGKLPEFEDSLSLKMAVLPFFFN